MCGRFTVSFTKKEIEALLLEDFAQEFQLSYSFPRYNIAPRQEVLGLVWKDDLVKPRTFLWGFVPSFSNKDGKKLELINSRIESLEDTWFLKEAYKVRRCLVLTDGFYEWEQTDQGKLPYRIVEKNKDLVYFAGLYSTNSMGEKDAFTCSILTKEAVGKVRTIHSRMPVMLRGDAGKRYLESGDLREEDFLGEDALRMYPVSKRVNRVDVDDVDLIKKEEPLRLDL